MLARVLSGAVLGVDAYLVRVEADVVRGIPSFSTVGLPQGAVREGKERVLAAIRNSGFELPPRRITINLAPADVRKEGSAFDLPIALGILIGTGQLSAPHIGRFLFLGELGLSGALRPIRGALAIALTVRDRRLSGMILPEQNGAEAAAVAGISVHGARTLREVVGFLEGNEELAGAQWEGGGAPELLPPGETLDLDDVQGQEHAKRALEIAAAGAHNLLMLGPPGSGKTMLARRMPGILPAPSAEEVLETSRIHSVAGLLSSGHTLVRVRPFRAPHHTISDAGLIGGGSNPRPGEVSLAHNGVLFLDELPEFRRNVLESLRQPLESQEVTIARASFSLTYPARFMLVGAMNPCPCGYHGDNHHSCTCSPLLIQRYLARLSGPLLDRIDLHIEVPAVREAGLGNTRAGEASTRVRGRVEQARERQRRRFAGSPAPANAYMSIGQLRRHCALAASDRQLLARAGDRLGLSGRAYHRVLKVARTIADLEGEREISTEHLAEAIQYRALDRGARSLMV